jgi:hypothetical protein
MRYQQKLGTGTEYQQYPIRTLRPFSLRFDWLKTATDFESFHVKRHGFLLDQYKQAKSRSAVWMVLYLEEDYTGDYNKAYNVMSWESRYVALWR